VDDSEFFKLNNWRQGDIIDDKSVVKVLVKNSSWHYPNDTSIPELIVVISQDCDIVHNKLEDEPYIYLLAGRFEKKDGNLFYSKNPRRLQIEQGKMVIGFFIHDILRVKKDVFIKYNPNHASMVFQKEIIKQIIKWISNRYIRAAFPNEFNNRLKASQVEKISKNLLMEKVSLIYIDVSDEELETDQVYRAALIIGVQHGLDQDSISQIEDLFYQSFHIPGIDAEVEVYDEYDITYEVISTYRRFNWDYRSTPENPNVSVPASNIDNV